VPPRLPVVLLADEGGPRPNRIDGVGAQALAQRRQREAAIDLLPEHADRGERAQQTIQSPWIGAGRGSEVVAALRAILQPIGDAERSGNVDRLRHLIAIDEAHERRRGPLVGRGHGLLLPYPAILGPEAQPSGG